MALVESDAFVVTSQRASAFAPFHTIRSLFAPTGKKAVYGVYERPPYPIIIETPTVYNVISNWRFSDFLMGGTFYGAGVIWAYIISRSLPSLAQRLVVFHGVSHATFVFAVF